MAENKLTEFKVTMKHPELPQGTEIDIDGVGVVKNGESITITPEMQEAWSNANDGLDMKKSMAQNGVLEFSGKDKLMDATRSVEEVVPEEQAARNKEGGEK